MHTTPGDSLFGVVLGNVSGRRRDSIATAPPQTRLPSWPPTLKDSSAGCAELQIIGSQGR